jgi:tetratricopeptide (TPR) repeat protein
VIADYDALPPPPPPDRPGFSLDLFIARDNPVKDRLLSVSVELGDNLFRRGRYREAQHHFELAFSLSRGHQEISVRLERCRQLAPPPPPPPVVVVAAPPVVVVRPRIAVFNFLVDAPPGVVPVGCDNWAADQLAACFAAQYEIIDRGEVCWWMGRLGITLRDVLNDPAARVALAQPLDARFFVFGGMRHTASFDVTAHLMDAQTGAKAGGGLIHVQDHNEMKLRMQELVAQATGTPAQAKQLAQDGRDSEKAVNDARRLLQAGKHAEASAAAGAGLQKYPNNVALKALQAQADQQAAKTRLEEARRQEAAREAAQAEAARKQQQELAKQAEAARVRAQQEAKSRDETAKRAQEAQKQRAFDNLIAQARAVTKAGSPQQAVALYDSALALKSDPAAARERDQLKANAAQATKVKADADKARHEAEAQRQREAALAAARARVEAEKKQREAEAAATQKAQEARDAAEQSRLVEQARGFLAKGQYDAAMGALLTARRLKKSDEVERLVAQVQEAQARAEAEKKATAAKAEAEKKMAAEKAAADADKAKRQAEYAKSMQAGRDAWSARRFDDAARAFGEALRIMPGDRDATAYQQQAIKARDDVRAMADAEARRKADEEKRRAEYTRLMNQGQTAMAAKRYDEAAKAYADALKVQPGDATATRAHRDAQAALDASKAPPKPPLPPKPPQTPAEYTRQMDAAGALEKQQKYAEAVPAYKAALRAVPNDTRATKGADFAQHMADGQKALAGRKFPDAVREFEAALKVMPNNADATAFLKRAKEGRP